MSHFCRQRVIYMPKGTNFITSMRALPRVKLSTAKCLRCPSGHTPSLQRISSRANPTLFEAMLKQKILVYNAGTAINCRFLIQDKLQPSHYCRCRHRNARSDKRRRRHSFGTCAGWGIKTGSSTAAGDSKHSLSD